MNKERKGLKELEEGRGAKRERESLETGGGTGIFKTQKPEEQCFKKGVLMDSIKWCYRASLVAQWLRVCLLMQGTRVRALVWEDPTCHGATGPVSHNY